MRTFVVATAVVFAVAGCTEFTKDTVVTNPKPPQDVWDLIDRAVEQVPLTVAKMESLLGTPMVQDAQNPRRWQGDAVQLAPALQVSSSVTAISDQGTWMFAAINVAPEPCISLQMVREYYPSVTLKYAPNGHSVYEEALWVVADEWGELGFGIREKDQCLAGFSLEPSSARRLQDSPHR